MITYVFGVAGLKYTSASNAGFIVGLNVILVPLINKIFFKSTATKKDYIKSFICFIGLILVTLKGTNPINIGDFYCFINAIGYSLYIIYNSRLSHDLDAKKLITLEYAFVGIPTLLYVLVFESFTINLNPNNIVSILILSLFCTFLAFYFQIKAQRHISSEKSSQILSLMPIFAVMFDVVFLKEVPTLYAIVGGILVILATMNLFVFFSKH